MITTRPHLQAPPSLQNLGSGQSLDYFLRSTGVTEDVFDGDNNFSISMWIKGWPADVNQSILSKSLIPTLKGVNPKLWLDAADSGSFVLTERNADQQYSP